MSSNCLEAGLVCHFCLVMSLMFTRFPNVWSCKFDPQECFTAVTSDRLNFS